MPSIFPIVTAATAAVLTVLLVVLAVRVALYRKRHRIGVGEGGDPRLLRRVRAHGNAAEFIPLGLVLILLLELARVSSVGVAVLAAVFTVARLLHAWGLSRSGGASVGRMLGASLTFVALLLMAGWLVLAVVRYQH